jgi:hypothetical protein
VIPVTKAESHAAALRARQEQQQFPQPQQEDKDRLSFQAKERRQKEFSEERTHGVLYIRYHILAPHAKGSVGRMYAVSS